MKRKALITSILLGGAGLLAYYFSTLTKTAQNVRVNLFGIKYDKTRTTSSFFTKIWFALTLKIENPTNRPVVLNETLLDFYVQGKKVGELKNFERLVIEAKRTTNFTAVTYINLLSIISLVSDIVKLIKDKTGIEISVKGTVKVEGNLIRIDETMPITYPTL
jgi:LEA14-like dessication related protein